MIWRQAARNIGQLAGASLKKGLPGTMTPMLAGAAVGAIAPQVGNMLSGEPWDGFGKTLTGATLGALGGRYGGAGLLRATNGGRSVFNLSKFGRGAVEAFSRDFRGARLAANQGISKIRAMGR